MPHTNYIITAPVNIKGDLAYIFGLSTGDLGTIIKNSGPTISGGVVTAEGNINKWAKYKPQLIDIIPQPVRNITDAERASASYPWGLYINALFRNVAQFVNNYGHNYEYRGFPTNGPYRALDFTKIESNGRASTTVGYNHNAKGFVSTNDIVTNSISTKNYYYIEHTESGIQVTVNWYRSARNDEISLADLNLGITSAINGYFAVLLVKNHPVSPTYRLICASSTIGSSETSTLTIPDSIFTVAGESYSIYPIVSLGNEGYTGEGAIVSASASLNWDIIAIPAKVYSFEIVNATSLLTGGRVTITSFTSVVGVGSRDTVSLAFSASLPNTPAAQDLGSVDVQFKIELWAGTDDTGTKIYIPGTSEGDYYITLNVGTGVVSHNASWILSQIYDDVFVKISHVGTSTYTYATATAHTTTI